MKVINFLRLILCYVCINFSVGCGDATPGISSGSTKSESTLDQVCKIAANQFGLRRSEINAETTLADLDADELDFVEIVISLEEQFHLAIPDDVAEQLLGPESWQTGMKNITMAKLAEMIGERKEDMPVAIDQAAIDTPQKRRIVNLTPIAATKLRELQQQDGRPFLRVSVISEGPTGYMYDLKFDDEANAGNDYLDEMEGISVVVDKRSALFLEDATIDWQTTADGRQGFEFDNPNAVK